MIVSLRHFLKGKISLRLQCAFWVIVLLGLLARWKTPFRGGKQKNHPPVCSGGAGKWFRGILNNFGPNVHILKFSGNIAIINQDAIIRYNRSFEMIYSCQWNYGGLWCTNTGIFPFLEVFPIGASSIEQPVQWKIGTKQCQCGGSCSVSFCKIAVMCCNNVSNAAGFWMFFSGAVFGAFSHNCPGIGKMLVYKAHYKPGNK